jgi:hypothetical protein
MLTDYFHKNFYPDLSIEEVEAALNKDDDTYNKAVEFVQQNHYGDVSVDEIKTKVGGRQPIVVYNPNDSRLRAFNDSNALYNRTRRQIGNYGNSPSNTDLYVKSGIDPREFSKPAYNFINQRPLNTSGRYDLNMNPNNSFPPPRVPQRILPIGGIGLVSDSMGGWVDIYKKPVQPYKYEKKPSYEEFLKTVNPDYLGDDYNLKEAYEKLPYSVTNAWAKDPEKNHLPDTFKLPNHSTFSNESIYYKEGMPAIRWEGDKAIPINQEPSFSPDIINTATPQTKTKLYQGYDFMQQTGLRPGDYTEEQIKEATDKKKKSRFFAEPDIPKKP